MTKQLLIKSAAILLIGMVALFGMAAPAPAQSHLLTVQVIDAANNPMSGTQVRFQACQLKPTPLMPNHDLNWYDMHEMGGGVYQFVYAAPIPSPQNAWKVVVTGPANDLNTAPIEIVTKPMPLSHDFYICKVPLRAVGVHLWPLPNYFRGG